MKLRSRLNLVVAGLSAVYFAVLLGSDVRNARIAIDQEIGASNIVAGQLLGRLASIYSRDGESEPLLKFFDELGRVRANNIILLAPDGTVLYHSPPSTYKAGRAAPDWFADLLTPALSTQRFALPAGERLIVAPDASRAVLDAWDSIVRLIIVAIILLIIVYGAASWSVARALKPFPIITEGLARIRRGELDYRLPTLAGPEARTIGDAFNSMAESVQDKVTAERQARDAESLLEERRELGRVVDQRLEEERRAIAHELHDEFSQSVTAIRSLAMAINARAGSRDPETGDTAHLIADEAARLYDAMHDLIPRLVPLTLDTLGLGETLENLVRDWQRRYPAIALDFRYTVTSDFGNSIALAVYRTVQEGLINALRHAHPSRVNIDVVADAAMLHVTIIDDGTGLASDWSRPGRFGLRGLTERVTGLGGTLSICNEPPLGAVLKAAIPLGTDDSPLRNETPNTGPHTTPEPKAGEGEGAGEGAGTDVDVDVDVDARFPNNAPAGRQTGHSSRMLRT